MPSPHPPVFLLPITSTKKDPQISLLLRCYSCRHGSQKEIQEAILTALQEDSNNKLLIVSHFLNEAFTLDDNVELGEVLEILILLSVKDIRPMSKDTKEFCNAREALSQIFSHPEKVSLHLWRVFLEYHLDKSQEVVLCGECEHCPKLLEKLSLQLKSFLPDSVLLIPPNLYNYGMTLYDGRIAINSRVIEDTRWPAEVKTCILMLTLLHELAHFTRMTYQGGRTYERTPEKYKEEAGDYFETQIFHIKLKDYFESIDEDLASKLLNWENWDINSLFDISEKLSDTTEKKKQARSGYTNESYQSPTKSRKKPRKGPRTCGKFQAPAALVESLAKWQITKEELRAQREKLLQNNLT